MASVRQWRTPASVLQVRQRARRNTADVLSVKLLSTVCAFLFDAHALSCSFSRFALYVCCVRRVMRAHNVCRLCAVFGGTYCLSQPISALDLDADGRVVNVIVDSDKRISCKQVVAGLACTPKAALGNAERVERVSRAIFLTNKPLQSTGKDEVKCEIIALISHSTGVHGTTVATFLNILLSTAHVTAHASLHCAGDSCSHSRTRGHRDERRRYITRIRSLEPSRSPRTPLGLLLVREQRRHRQT